MAEQAPKDPVRRAAEIRYRNKAFGPGPEKEIKPFRGRPSSGVQYGKPKGPHILRSGGEPHQRVYERKKGPSGPRPTKPNWYSQEGTRLT